MTMNTSRAKKSASQIVEGTVPYDLKVAYHLATRTHSANACYEENTEDFFSRTQQSQQSLVEFEEFILRMQQEALDMRNKELLASANQASQSSNSNQTESPSTNSKGSPSSNSNQGSPSFNSKPGSQDTPPSSSNSNHDTSLESVIDSWGGSVFRGSYHSADSVDEYEIKEGLAVPEFESDPSDLKSIPCGSAESIGPSGSSTSFESSLSRNNIIPVDDYSDQFSVAPPLTPRLHTSSPEEERED